jgi:uncharacterized protein YbaR (Trm112 family)
MVDPELLEILVCPETHQTLRPADAELLDKLNHAISGGEVTNRGGQAVDAPIAEALVREDGRLLYVVRSDIPIMLIDEAIDLTGLSEGGPTEESGESD